MSEAVATAGMLHARFARRDGATTLVESFQRPPLQILRPFEREGICEAMLLHNGGGIVAGDALDMALELEPGAHAVVSTASAGKLYRSTGAIAHQKIRLDLAANATLEWLPQETIAFEASRFRQDVTVRLAPGACFLGWEVCRFGRSARGERFVAGEWRSHLSIWRGEQPIWIDRQWLPGSEAVWAGAHGLAGRAVVGTLVFAGLAPDGACLAEVRAAAAGLDGETGASRLPKGLVCRYRGDSSEEARRWFVRVWALLRELQGLPSPVLPRAWHAFQG